MPKVSLKNNWEPGGSTLKTLKTFKFHKHLSNHMKQMQRALQNKICHYRTLCSEVITLLQEMSISLPLSLMIYIDFHCSYLYSSRTLCIKY